MSSPDLSAKLRVDPGGLYRLQDWQIVPAPGARPLPVADARALDRFTTDRFGIPTLLLMERAALGLEVVALEMLRGVEGNADSEADTGVNPGSAPTSAHVSGTSGVVILCGPGSNGGDGFALGRLLLDRGIPVVILGAPGAGASGDAAVNRTIFERLGRQVVASGFRPMGASQGAGMGEGAGVGGDPSGSASPGRAMPPAPHLIVDALFGTGLSRAIEGPAAELVAWAEEARRAGAPVLAVDIPSGIDSETGEALGPAVTADTTVTLVGPKPGLLTPAGRDRCGRIVIAPIGVEGIVACVAAGSA